MYFHTIETGAHRPLRCGSKGPNDGRYFFRAQCVAVPGWAARDAGGCNGNTAVGLVTGLPASMADLGYCQRPGILYLIAKIAQTGKKAIVVDGGLNNGKLAGDVIHVESLRHQSGGASTGHISVVGQHLRADAPISTGQAGAYRGANNTVFQYVFLEYQGSEKIGELGDNNGHRHVSLLQS
jgi:hypothetical protein